MARALTAERLKQENAAFQGTGGVSACSRDHGFRPAFLDTETGTIYISCSRNGQPAPFHRLDGLPEELISERDERGHVIAVKQRVISGFERDGCFYTREQAACFVVSPAPRQGA
ncbi:MAG: hypothetical protein ACLFMS_05170 [Halorhodospira sp.]